MDAIANAENISKQKATALEVINSFSSHTNHSYTGTVSPCPYKRLIMAIVPKSAIFMHV